MKLRHLVIGLLGAGFAMAALAQTPLVIKFSRPALVAKKRHRGPGFAPGMPAAAAIVGVRSPAADGAPKASRHGLTQRKPCPRAADNLCPVTTCVTGAA